LTADRFRCSTEARDREEPLFATASTVAAWLAIEQPGPWGPEAMLESRLPIDVAIELERRAAVHGVRALLIRRGRYATGERVILLAHSAGPEPVLIRQTLNRPEDVLDVDLAALAAGEALGPRELRPVYLVCTHGRHDICCADRGRPLYRAASALLPERVWETSHIGGDRFAGNLLVLPHGAYFGRVEPEEATRVIDSFELGRLELDRYRGRSSMHRIAQAADHFMRTRFGWTGIDDVEVVGLKRLAPGEAEVSAHGPGGENITVRVAYESAAGESVLTCRAPHPSRPPVFSAEPIA
jgi:hypothetical protein